MDPSPQREGVHSDGATRQGLAITMRSICATAMPIRKVACSCFRDNCSSPCLLQSRWHLQRAGATTLRNLWKTR